ncbi:MAG TPA: TolC family protein [Polyangia bacterium]
MNRTSNLKLFLVPVVPALLASGSFVARTASAAPAANAGSGASTTPGVSAAPAAGATVLTPDEVARRAQRTSYDLRARGEARAAADAALDQAKAAFLPRLSGTARYTRLSNLTPPALGNIVVAPPNAQPNAPVDPNSLVAVPFTFPVIVNQYAAQATLQIPLSDYLLRLAPARDAAESGLRAASLDETATRASVGLDARLAYYDWVRAHKQAEVARAALAQARGHLDDVRKGADVGTASPADVLRVESQVASAELLVTRADNARDLGLQQLRTIMHDESDRAYTFSDEFDLASASAADATAGAAAADSSVAAGGSPPPTALAALATEAADRRPELRALDAAAEAARRQAGVARSGSLPRLDAVGNAIYANPNPRIIPQDATYRGTWDATIQLSWSPTDIPAAEAGRRAALARAAQLEAQRAAALDAIRLEVDRAARLQAESRTAVGTARRGLRAAEESYRVRQLLFRNGRATSVELTDAETELTRARLEVIAAEIDLRVAGARLDHALGRDIQPDERKPAA